MNLFISYRREDSIDIAGRLADRLIAEFGKKNIFIDVDSIPLGVDFRVHLDNEVSKCDMLLAIIGPDWVGETQDHQGALEGRRIDDDADFVRLEVASALSRSIPVVPVLVRGAKLPKPDDLPPDLREIVFRNAIEIGSGAAFHESVSRLLRGLRHHAESQKSHEVTEPLVRDAADSSQPKTVSTSGKSSTNDIVNQPATQRKHVAQDVSTNVEWPEIDIRVQSLPPTEVRSTQGSKFLRIAPRQIVMDGKRYRSACRAAKRAGSVTINHFGLPSSNLIGWNMSLRGGSKRLTKLWQYDVENRELAEKYRVHGMSHAILMPDGKHIIVPHHRSGIGEFEVWNLENDHRRVCCAQGMPASNTDPSSCTGPTTLLVAEHGVLPVVVVRRPNPTIEVSFIDTEDWAERQSISIDAPHPIWEISPDGKLFFVAHNNPPVIDVWNVDGGQKSAEFEATAGIQWLRYEPRSEILIVESVPNIKLLNRQGRLVAQWAGKIATVSSDGEFLATSSGVLLNVWSFRSQELREIRLQPHSDISMCQLEFTPDSNWLLVRKSDSIRLVNTNTWSETFVIPTHRFSNSGPSGFTREGVHRLEFHSIDEVIHWDLSDFLTSQDIS